MEAQSLPESCKLHLDVLELIVNEHRNDHATLATIALASRSFLQMSRKHLYRSVSLDYCENPYGYEQQQQLRSSLASYPHLCSYIRSLRLGLPVINTFDPDLDDILRALARVENLHLIGNAGGLDYDFVGGTTSYVSPVLGSVEFGSLGTTTTRSRRDVGEALKKVFKLRSLKKVKLENIYPLDEVYLSHFTSLKHLELLCVGIGSDGLGLLPQSQSNASSVGTFLVCNLTTTITRV